MQVQQANIQLKISDTLAKILSVSSEASTTQLPSSTETSSTDSDTNLTGSDISDSENENFSYAEAGEEDIFETAYKKGLITEKQFQDKTFVDKDKKTNNEMCIERLLELTKKIGITAVKQYMPVELATQFNYNQLYAILTNYPNLMKEENKHLIPTQKEIQTLIKDLNENKLGLLHLKALFSIEGLKAQKKGLSVKEASNYQFPIGLIKRIEELNAANNSQITAYAILQPS